MMKNNSSGFSLIGVLLIIGALVITAGGVLVLPAGRQVWQKRVLPGPRPPSQKPQPTEAPTLVPRVSPTTLPEQPADGCSGLHQRECEAREGCVSVYGSSCPACMDVVFKRCRERRQDEIKKAPWGIVDTLSFPQLWQKRDELLWQRVTVKARARLLVACPHYEGCCKPEECAGTVILGENLGNNYVSIFLHEAGERVTCRWPKENSSDCQGWEKDGEYLVTGILGQEKYSFYLEVLSKQKL